MVNLTYAYAPALIKGLRVDSHNPLRFNFILDAGESGLSRNALIKEGDRLVQYFFACLTIPEKDLWVNLSPYEKGRIIPEALGNTSLGRDLLAQDYILKQLTASIIYPGHNLGKAFWDRVYAKVSEVYGKTEIPINTFNKVWILADRAVVYEHDQLALVKEAHLKVMLDEDYLALEKHAPRQGATLIPDPHALGASIVRSIILPEIEKEVNTGKNFAILRQIYNSLILAVWYKKSLKEAILNQVYANKSKVQGINLMDPSIKLKIYQQYLLAYKRGVFNFIKEEIDPMTQHIVPRKYFSGGFKVDAAMLRTTGDASGNQEIFPNPQSVFEMEVGVSGIQPVHHAMVAVAKAHESSIARESFTIEELIANPSINKGNPIGIHITKPNPEEHNHYYRLTFHHGNISWSQWELNKNDKIEVFGDFLIVFKVIELNEYVDEPVAVYYKTKDGLSKIYPNVVKNYFKGYRVRNDLDRINFMALIEESKGYPENPYVTEGDETFVSEGEYGKNPSMIANKSFKKGGIDLNMDKAMGVKINKDGPGVKITVDALLKERMYREGIHFLKPVIIALTPIADIWFELKV